MACASALGRGPVGGGLWPRIPFEGNSNPSKGILEFSSKGIRRELEGCWKYYALCRAHPATITYWDNNDGVVQKWAFIRNNEYRQA